MAAAKAATSKAAASNTAPANNKVAATKPCTAVVAYRVDADDVENFLNAWDRANEFLKKQPGHVSTTLHRAISANPPFRFVNIAKWKTVDDFRKATQSHAYMEASGWLEAYPVYASAYDTIRG